MSCGYQQDTRIKKHLLQIQCKLIFFEQSLKGLLILAYFQIVDSDFIIHWLSTKTISIFNIHLCRFGLKTKKMQRDFHYHAIRVIAEKAGFSPADAQIVAYASEYVDDATKHSKIQIPVFKTLQHSRYDGKYFDPVCTAHRGVQFVKGLKKSFQLKIYIPFHFIPETEYSGQGDYNYRTSPGNDFALQLVDDALIRLKHATSNDAKTSALIGLGIALHSYADTWAHQGFSGRHSSVENDIGNVEFYDRAEWKKWNFYERAEHNILPDIGHAEAGTFPDKPHLQWRYVLEHTKKTIERDNIAIFTSAAKNIFELLQNQQSKCKWHELEPRLTKCFEVPVFDCDDRIKLFYDEFKEIKFDYDDEDWEEAALGDDDVEDYFYQKDFDMKWFYFHEEALRQRFFVMDRIKTDI